MYAEILSSIKSFLPLDFPVKVLMVIAALIIMWGFNRVFYKEESN